MICIVKDLETSKMVYKYDGIGQVLFSQLEASIRDKSFAEGISKGRYYKKIQEGGRAYYYCIDNVKTRKIGKYQVKVIHMGMHKLCRAIQEKSDIQEYVKDVALHNTRNIHNSILERLKNTFVHSELVHSSDKVKFVSDIIASDVKGKEIGKDILSTLKGLEQVAYDYDIIDFISKNEEFSEKDYITINVHTLLVQVFYIYEYDFGKRGIRFNIAQNYDKIVINFYTFRSAMSLLLENCLKYTLENTDIAISMKTRQEEYIIDLTMKSILNTDDEIEKMFLPEFRGKNAEIVCPSKGKGLGMYIAKILMGINGINIDFEILDDIILYDKKRVEYCTNRLRLILPKDRVTRQ